MVHLNLVFLFAAEKPKGHFGISSASLVWKCPIGAQMYPGSSSKKKKKVPGVPPLTNPSAEDSSSSFFRIEPEKVSIHDIQCVSYSEGVQREWEFLRIIISRHAPTSSFRRSRRGGQNNKRASHLREAAAKLLLFLRKKEKITWRKGGDFYGTYSQDTD